MMFNTISKYIPNPDMVADVSWRLGVFITLNLLTIVTFATANRVLSDITPKAAHAVSLAIQIGLVLMVFSLVVSVLAHGLRFAQSGDG